MQSWVQAPPEHSNDAHNSPPGGWLQSPPRGTGPGATQRSFGLKARQVPRPLQSASVVQKSVHSGPPGRPKSVQRRVTQSRWSSHDSPIAWLPGFTQNEFPPPNPAQPRVGPQSLSDVHGCVQIGVPLNEMQLNDAQSVCPPHAPPRATEPGSAHRLDTHVEPAGHSPSFVQDFVQ